MPNWKYFKLQEFTCRCGCGQTNMVPEFIDKLDALRDKLGFGLTINSGYRCPEYNAKISTTGRNGPHTKGRAADIGVDRGRCYELLAHAKEFGFTGIGLLQKGAVRYVHLDDLPPAQGQPRPSVWTY